VKESSSFEDEDRSITRAFPEGHLAPTPVSEGDEKTPLTGILGVMELRQRRRRGLSVVGRRTSLRGGRALSLDASLVLHFFKAENKRSKTLSKKETKRRNVRLFSAGNE
jgi:hypothetical protein